MSKAITDLADGRRLRSARSRQAIVDALIDLVNEGTLVPTAQQIADRAGVGIRTLFRHFSDIESVFVDADAQKREWYESLFSGGDRSGTVEQRIGRAIKQRANAYESTKNASLSTHAQRWRYKFLRDNYAGYLRGQRKNLESWLPEIKLLDSTEREAAHAVVSFEMWHRLREYQGLSKKRATDTIVGLLRRLLVAD